MKKLFSIFLIIQLLLLWACSTQKDNLTSRTYHNVSTKYNVLYNGNRALEKGIIELNDQYEDNYWVLLPVEPLKINEEFIDINISKNENNAKSTFDIAEEKAVKAVQKHSMYIKGKEKNKQIDDAYLLLGKARYYSQRFVPALEAFEYSLKNDFNSDLSTELRIWKAKTQIRLQNEELAAVFLKLVLKKEFLKKSEKEDAHTSLAMAYIAMDSIPLAIKQLQFATETDENKDQHARNLFILGQLYNLEKNKDSSFWAFNEVIGYKKASHKYKVHALLEQVNIVEDDTVLASLKEKINKLAKNPINKPYLDEIHYTLAEIDFKEGNDSLALLHLTKSANFPDSKKFQKVLSYEKMGNYYFDKNNFVKAGTYYDSILPNVENSNTTHIKKIERRIKNLEDVVFFEKVLAKNDSILGLVQMNDIDRTNFFQTYIEVLKNRDKIEAIKRENAERAQNPENQIINLEIGKDSQKGKWYFYNTQTLTYGKEEFMRVWGKRSFKDNWRWSEVKTNNINDDNLSSQSNDISTKNNAEEKTYDINTYLNAIPKDQSLISKIKEERSNALYQLGLIYKEKFQQYSLAKGKLERFLAENPKENFILPAKYHLLKIYEKLSDSKMEIMKMEIINQYPNSRYAQLLQNNELKTENDSIKTPEVHYEKVYCDFEYNFYDSVIAQCEEASKLYADDPIQAKFELLKAYALYHTKGNPQFMEGLEFVITNFPKSEEAIHAQEVLNRINNIPNTKSDSENNLDHTNKLKEPIKQLTEEEKRQKVLEMMKNQGQPDVIKNK